MAIAIEGFSIVGIKSRIEEKYPNGLAGLSAAVPNVTALADDDLWRCAFMAAADAERFVEQLEKAGLNASQGPDPDIVLVNEFDQSATPYCEWLQISQWKKGVVAWLTGTNPQTLVAREGWTPEVGSGLQYAPSPDDENFEFVRLDGNVAVYFDKRRGREVYVGRTAPDSTEVYKAAAKVIASHMINPGQPKIADEIEEKVRQAVADLQKVVQEFPEAWEPHFFIGKGKQSYGEMEGAYEAMRRAYELEKETESVPRELAGLFLELGRSEEAVQIGQKAAALKPDSHETLGNLACALLISGRLVEAATTIQAALKLKATDRTNLHLKRILEEVETGKRPQPRKLSDLANPIQRTTTQTRIPESRMHKGSFWSRLLFWKHSR